MSELPERSLREDLRPLPGLPAPRLLVQVARRTVGPAKGSVSKSLLISSSATPNKWSGSSFRVKGAVITTYCTPPL